MTDIKNTTTTGPTKIQDLVDTLGSTSTIKIEDRPKKPKVDSKSAQIKDLSHKLQLEKNKIKLLKGSLQGIATANTRHRALWLVQDILKKIK